MKKIAIFISGRGSNMAAIAANCENGILKNIAQIAFVFSNKITAEGLAIAKAKKIPTICIPSQGKTTEEFNQEIGLLLAAYDLDLIVLAGFMRLISKEIILKYSKKIINIHPADTLLHQGKNGYEWAWQQQLKSTKITVHYVNAYLDKGAIIAQIKVPLINCKSLKEVKEKGLAAEYQLYSKVIVCLLKI